MRSKPLADAVRLGLCALALAQLSLGATLASAAENHDKDTATPIKHVIVIIGENRSFDHVFATYVPTSGETVDNLLSKGIVALDTNKRAVPGPHFELAQQLAARDAGRHRCVLAESAQRGISAQRAARAARGRPEILLHSERVRPGHAARRLPGKSRSWRCNPNRACPRMRTSIC